MLVSVACMTDYRADHVGSLLRPPALLQARERYQDSDDELRTLEDTAIAEAVRRQQDAGISVVTDGEIRRQDFRSGFAAAVDGFTMEPWALPWHGPDGVTAVPGYTWIVTGRLRQHWRLAGSEAGYLLGVASAPVKVTLIAPGFMLHQSWQDGVTDQFYSSREELGAELAAITKAEIEGLIADGVRYVQLDNPGYSLFLGPERDEAAFKRALSADIAAVSGIERPPGVVIGLHLCRGNQSSRWLGAGAYDPIAEQIFSSLPVDRLLLEYDDERSGGFEPLRFVPKGTTAVLGLVSSKTPVLEESATLARRIDEAATFIDGDQIALSPQCGFASVAAGGNLLTPDEQYAKLKLVADTAQTIWT
jgi:methionine synthase II (cobalamin-independent)